MTPTGDEREPHTPADGGAPAPAPSSSRQELRWRAFFQQTSDPLFVLSSRRRVLFVNTAWETLTGIPAEQMRGAVCRLSASTGSASTWEEVVARALAPPPEVIEGRPGMARRLLPGAAGPLWWDVAFFPLRAAERLLMVLGRISPLRSEAHPHEPMPEKLVALREQVLARHAPGLLDARTPAMQRVARQVRLAARSTARVFLTGAAGTGKRTVARIIHASGDARERSFAALDCERLPVRVIVDLLLDPRGGLGRQGVETVYLREPGHLPRDVQLRLAELLLRGEEHPDGAAWAPRLLAGSWLAVEVQTAEGKLQEELGCLLSTVRIDLPPLRDRPADLPLLVHRVLEEAGQRGGRPCRLSEGAWEVLRRHPWPGNLRELREVLHAAAGRGGEGEIGEEDLPARLRLPQRVADAATRPADRPLPLDQLLEQAERRLIELALRRARGNKTRAAELLGVWRQRLLRRMEALAIQDPEKGAGEDPSTRK